MSGERPKLALSEPSVGPATFSRPSSAVNTRAIVPFPARFGPTNKKIFCCRVSLVNQYPKASPNVWIASVSSPQTDARKATHSAGSGGEWIERDR